MLLRVACIVEGDGEVAAVPILVQRIARVEVSDHQVVVPRPLRAPSSKLAKADELKRFVQLAAGKAGPQGGILILYDCDDGCPARDGPALLARARAARSDFPIAVVLAKKEYESWFLAAAESLRGQRGLPADLAAPANPESRRGAKEWLGKHLPPNRKYSETLDQPGLTRCFDLQEARKKADSFDKCFRAIAALLKELCQRRK